MRGEQSTKRFAANWVAGPRAFGADDGRRHRRRLPERPARNRIVSGLVLYQLVFVVNVMRVVTSQEEWGDDAVRREDDSRRRSPHFGLFGLTFDRTSPCRRARAGHHHLHGLSTAQDRHGWRAGKISAHLGDPARRHGGDLVNPPWATRQAIHSTGMTVFVFVLVSNWIGFLRLRCIPGNRERSFRPHERRESAPRPRALCHRVGAYRITARATPRGYIKHYGKPAGWLTPINSLKRSPSPSR